ncbi:alanine dehydrogenase [Pseudorhizobium tarimense]|uniref:Alanine dehydrogenase n=1 Tax=Pseudorhizobium tarimense TaxID=1079109 RepID=A0ABV2HC11_9HYPH|nr:ornithine cyclodeaminase [Pseudorhizobium tarimense]MCJ8521144.1 ornithine cyclodeaminase [Pseudorhizobium tarimense]
MAVEHTNSFKWYDRNEIAACDGLLDGARLHRVARRAFDDIAAGTAYGLKSTISISADELPELKTLKRTSQLPERLGWKLSCLSSVNKTYGGVKIVGANALNRRIGLARSSSTILLLDKLTMTPLCAMDATDISAARTASYATFVIDRFFQGRERISIFLFGAGPIAERIILAIEDWGAHLVNALTVQSRTRTSAADLVARLRPRISFELTAADGAEALAQSDLIITATNAKSPVFEATNVRDALVLHLGGDETPGGYLQQAIRQGLVLCDSIEMVSRRNSQSLALYFSRRGTTLEHMGPLLGIENLGTFKGKRPVGAPTHITCVGLPMLDLYVGAYVYETLLLNENNQAMLAPGV